MQTGGLRFLVQPSSLLSSLSWIPESKVALCKDSGAIGAQKTGLRYQLGHIVAWIDPVGSDSLCFTIPITLNSEIQRPCAGGSRRESISGFEKLVWEVFRGDFYNILLLWTGKNQETCFLIMFQRILSKWSIFLVIVAVTKSYTTSWPAESFFFQSGVVCKDFREAADHLYCKWRPSGHPQSVRWCKWNIIAKSKWGIIWLSRLPFRRYPIYVKWIPQK